MWYIHYSMPTPPLTATISFHWHQLIRGLFVWLLHFFVLHIFPWHFLYNISFEAPVNLVEIESWFSYRGYYCWGLNSGIQEVGRERGDKISPLKVLSSSLSSLPHCFLFSILGLPESYSKAWISVLCWGQKGGHIARVASGLFLERTEPGVCCIRALRTPRKSNPILLMIKWWLTKGVKGLTCNFLSFFFWFPWCSFRLCQWIITISVLPRRLCHCIKR